MPKDTNALGLPALMIISLTKVGVVARYPAGIKNSTLYVPVGILENVKVPAVRPDPLVSLLLVAAPLRYILTPL